MHSLPQEGQRRQGACFVRLRVVRPTPPGPGGPGRREVARPRLGGGTSPTPNAPCHPALRRLLLPDSKAERRERGGGATFALSAARWQP